MRNFFDEVKKKLGFERNLSEVEKWNCVFNGGKFFWKKSCCGKMTWLVFLLVFEFSGWEKDLDLGFGVFFKILGYKGL